MLQERYLNALLQEHVCYAPGVVCISNIVLEHSDYGPGPRGVATRGQGGAECLTAKNLPKIGEKRGKSEKEEKSGRGAKIGKGLLLCPS